LARWLSWQEGGAEDRAHDEQANAGNGGVRDADALYGAGQGGGTAAGHSRRGAAGLRCAGIVLGKVLVMTGPQDQAAGGDRLRAAHTDREQVIEALKAAFVHGRLTKDEFDTRAGQALSARTYADLSALTADIPAAHVDPAAPVPVRAPTVRAPAVRAPAVRAPAVRRPLAKAAAGSGVCLVIAFAARAAVEHFDPAGAGPDPQHYMAAPFILLGFLAVFGALGILVVGVAASVNQRRSRRQPPPGPGGRALGGERPEGTGRLVPPGRPADKNEADLRAHKPRRRRRPVPAQTGRAPGGATAAPGAV
jgi:hypothetical protein